MRQSFIITAVVGAGSTWFTSEISRSMYTDLWRACVVQRSEILSYISSAQMKIYSRNVR